MPSDPVNFNWHGFKTPSIPCFCVEQAGLALDPGNNGLESSLAQAKEGQEAERRERWRQAALEREAQEEKLKTQDAAKAKEKVATAEANARSHATPLEPASSADPLSSFLSEIQGEKNTSPRPQVERILNDKYTNQELGNPRDQMDRLLQHNYKWKNLNAFETLQLGTDATVEDLKQRYPMAGLLSLLLTSVA